MSVNYASGLSKYPWKGKCGLKEIHDSNLKIEECVTKLVHLIKMSKHIVVHTGAGISTSAGIPDFRGPNGVWTLEERGECPKVNMNFDEAHPTKTHLAILALQQSGVVKHVISQNIDGLHLRSGYPRSRLSELHGNMFVEKCERCSQEYYRTTPVKTMALKRTGNICSEKGKRGLTHCRGKLKDTILDWEDSLPVADLIKAEEESRKADLSICLGTTLQIVPSGKLPLLTLKNGGHLVIVNLQKTRYDKKASLVIHAYVDDVMERVMNRLGFAIPNYNPDLYLGTVTLLDNRCERALHGVKAILDDDNGETPTQIKKEGDESGPSLSKKPRHTAVENMVTSSAFYETKRSPERMPNFKLSPKHEVR